MTFCKIIGKNFMLLLWIKRFNKVVWRATRKYAHKVTKFENFEHLGKQLWLNIIRERIKEGTFKAEKRLVPLCSNLVEQIPQSIWWRYSAFRHEEGDRSLVFGVWSHSAVRSAASALVDQRHWLLSSFFIFFFLLRFSLICREEY